MAEKKSGGIVNRIMKAAVPTVVIVVALQYFGYLGVGKKSPEFLVKAANG